MKRTLIIALLALATVPAADASIRWPWHRGKTVALSGAGELSDVPTTITLESQEQASKLFTELSNALNFLIRDTQAAYDSAVLDKDQVAIDCHQTGLNVLNTINTAANQQHVVGLISANQALRHTRRTALLLQPKLDDLRDKCAAIYPVAATFRPVLKPLGLVRLLP